MGKIYLNLGCGELPIKDTINVDLIQNKYVDKVANLKIFPWPWPDNSIDGIYMLHLLEHFPEPLQVIKECYRILKPRGFLFIASPHSSSVTGKGCIDHYRTFAVGTFKEYLSDMFTTEMQKVLWIHFPREAPNKYGIDFKVNVAQYPRILYWFGNIMQKLINISPNFFERFWCYWIGGAEEVVWRGIKI